MILHGSDISSKYNRIHKAAMCVVAILMLAAILLTGCGDTHPTGDDMVKQAGTDISEATGKSAAGKQIFMIYMIGSDLETDRGLASSDINEIVSAGFDTDRVEVYLCTGGALSWHNNDISSGECGIYKIIDGEINRSGSLTDDSMVNSVSVTEFMDHVYSETESVQEAEYHMIFWDHGGGAILGFGRDENNANGHLSIPDLTDAIRSSRLISEKGKLKSIGFDACIMSMAEVGCALSEYADHMIASETIENEKGWDYSFFKDVSDGGLTGTDIYKRIADKYADSCKTDTEYISEYSVAVCDLSEIHRIREGLEELITVADAYMKKGGYSSLVRIRTGTEELVRKGMGSDIDYDVVDAYALAKGFGVMYESEANALCQAIDDTVEYSVTNIPDVNGVALYFPYSNKDNMEEWLASYKELGFSDVYYGFLEDFTGILNGKELSVWDMAQTAPAIVESDGTDTVISIELSPEQLDSLGKAAVMTWIDRSGEEVAPEFGMWLSTTEDVWIDDNENRLYARVPNRISVLTGTDDGYEWGTVTEYSRDTSGVTYKINGGYVPAESEEVHTLFASVLVRVDDENPDGRVIGIYDAYELMGRDDETDLLPERMRQVKLPDIFTVVTHARVVEYDAVGIPLPFDEWGTGRMASGRLDISSGIGTRRIDIDEIMADIKGEIVYYLMLFDTQGNEHMVEVRQ